MILTPQIAMGCLQYIKNPDTGLPFNFSEGQKEIFKIIVSRWPVYNHIITPTQYGKSLIVASGILVSAAIGGQKWAIVAPTYKKAKIIMNYIIQHAFDSVYFYSQLTVDSSLEKLKRERTRERIVFKGGGEIFIVSAEAGNKKKAGEALMGFGAPNLALDESSLIDDDIYATALRMVGGSKQKFVVEIGNPFKRNHFFRTSKDPDYNHIWIDYHRAIREGRMDMDFIKKMKVLPFFSILYECLFPEQEMVDIKGFTVLVSEKTIDAKIEKKVTPVGRPRLGVDIGRGGDKSVFVVRYDNYAEILEKNEVIDLMYQVKRIQYYKEKLKIKDNDIFVDDIGVGGGVTDRCLELEIMLSPVKVGESAIEKDKYKNAKAEINWAMKEWLEEDHTALQEHKDFYEICYIKYKEDSSSKLLIEPKEDLRKVLGHSPDTPDALALTFYTPLTVPEFFVV